LTYWFISHASDTVKMKFQAPKHSCFYHSYVSSGNIRNVTVQKYSTGLLGRPTIMTGGLKFYPWIFLPSRLISQADSRSVPYNSTSMIRS